MAAYLARLHWGRIGGAAVAAYAASMAATVLLVTAYAFMLGFEARGAPDPARISAFARQVGPTWGPVLLATFTAFAALWVARQSQQPIRHGVLVGAIAATTGLLTGWPPDLRDAGFFGVVMGAGWTGAVIGQYATSPRLDGAPRRS